MPDVFDYAFSVQSNKTCTTKSYKITHIICSCMCHYVLENNIYKNIQFMKSTEKAASVSLLLFQGSDQFDKFLSH